MMYIKYSNWIFNPEARFSVSGSMTNRGTAIRTPAAKAAIIPNSLRYLTVKRPPAYVEKKAIAPNTTRYGFIEIADNSRDS